jgi:hypothetical protein
MKKTEDGIVVNAVVQNPTNEQTIKVEGEEVTVEVANEFNRKYGETLIGVRQFLTDGGVDEEEVGSLMEIMSQIIVYYHQKLPGGARGEFTSPMNSVSKRLGVMSLSEEGLENPWTIAHETIHGLVWAKDQWRWMADEVNEVAKAGGARVEKVGTRQYLPGGHGDIGLAVEEGLTEITRMTIFPESGYNRSIIKEDSEGFKLPESRWYEEIAYEVQIRCGMRMIEDLATMSYLSADEIRRGIATLVAKGDIREVPGYIEEVTGGYDGFGIGFIVGSFFEVGLRQ